MEISLYISYYLFFTKMELFGSDLIYKEDLAA